MTFSLVPNWLRIALLALSLLSFLPQLRHTIYRKNGTGISICYILFNLFSATEQFSMAFYFVVEHIGNPTAFCHDPVTTGDWLNFAQTAIVAVLWLVLFTVCLLLPSNHAIASKIFALLVYIAFLYISIIPLYEDYMHPPRKGREFGANLWFGIHAWLITKVVLGLSIVAIYCQAKEIRSRPWERALSRVGITVQAVVFSLVAVSWVLRVEYPWGEMSLSWESLLRWYYLVGWAPVFNAVFALGQAVLLAVVWRSGRVGGRVCKGETEPLLRA
ncbi:hypothetical protein CC86DRAFT_405973 [Ophiobolus disseminans]|uniref:Uncharacterized protein n=1 Tax=Ophiobolus disseminans TaxID=1469910 RepID=A0A6A7A2E4_9PLEO|nr:hypothetical protein CC86DRAFT_405973 [Ophiobolus disseminans]